MDTVPFPVDVLKPIRGTAKPDADAIDIQIPFEPFALPAIGEIRTKLWIESTELPRSVSALSCRRLALPSNPEPGYVDASMYIEHRHHIVDIHQIAFGERRADTLPATFTCTILFSVEGLTGGENIEYADTPWQFTCLIDFEPVRDSELIAKERWFRKLAKRISRK